MMENIVGPPEGGGQRDPSSFGNAKQDIDDDAERAVRPPTVGQDLEIVPSIRV